MAERTLDELRADAATHGTQIEAMHWLGVPDLAARWNVSAGTVRKIPRAALPYITFGGTSVRRYDPRDVEHYEQTAKHGEGVAA